jgi:hypothetical protein
MLGNNKKSIGFDNSLYNNKSNFDVSYQAVLDRATVLGYTKPTQAQQTIQSNLIIALKLSGVWALRDVIYSPANNGSKEFGTLNWKNPSINQMTLISSPTWTSNLGYSGNGTSSYVDLNYNPNTQGVQFTLNNHAYEAWNLISAPQQGVLLSAFGVNYNEISLDNTNNRIIVYDSSPIGRLPTLAAGQQNGWYMNERISALDAGWLTYRNNVNLPHIGAVSISTPNVNFRLFARDNNTFFGNGQVPFCGAGASLSTQQKTDYYNLINTYLGAL